MLVRIIDIKGREFHVNPLYIKSISEKKPGRTMILGSFTSMGGAMYTQESVGEVADRVSVALAAMGAAGFAAVETEQRAQQQAAAAATAG